MGKYGTFFIIIIRQRGMLFILVYTHSTPTLSVVSYLKHTHAHTHFKNCIKRTTCCKTIPRFVIFDTISGTSSLYINLISLLNFPPFLKIISLICVAFTVSFHLSQ